MKTIILRSAICAVIVMCLSNCKKNNDNSSQPTRTTMQGTAISFSAEAIPLNTGEVYYTDGGITFTDNETKQKYSLDWDMTIASDANGYATIDSLELFTDQTVVKKVTDTEFSLTNIDVPNSITIQVKNDISDDDLKNKMFGFKTIKVDFTPSTIYYLGNFFGKPQLFEQYFNDMNLLKEHSRKSLVKQNNSAQNLDGNQLDLVLTKRQ